MTSLFEIVLRLLTCFCTNALNFVPCCQWPEHRGCVKSHFVIVTCTAEAYIQYAPMLSILIFLSTPYTLLLLI